MSHEPSISFFRIISPLGPELPKFLSTYEKPFFALIRADLIRTRLQVEHAYRISMEDSAIRGKIQKPESVFLMLMTGIDQIKESIENGGIGRDVKQGAAVYDDRSHYKRFLDRYGSIVEESHISVKDDDRSLDAEIFPKMTYTRMKIRI